MIRIRYRGSNELSPGLHATAEQYGRTTTVYLLSGMTAAQRRSALRRLRLTARMGHCPRLPAAQLGFALFTDRIRTGFGRTGAVLRLHPAGSTVPIMVLSGGAIAFLLFSTVSIHVLHPRTANQSDTGTPPVASASAIAIGGGSQSQATGLGGPGNAGNPAGSGGSADQGSRGTDARQLTRPSSGPADTTPALAAGAGTGSGAGPGASGAAGGSGSSGSASSAKNGSGKSSSDGTAGGTTLSGGTDPTQATPQQSTPATSAPAPAPANTAPAATPSSPGASSSKSPGGVCVDVGPLGVCLKI